MQALHRRARGATSLAFALQGFLLAAILTQLPQYQDRFALTDTLIVIAVVMVSLIAGAGSVAADYLAGLASSKTTLMIGLAIITVSGGAIGLASTTATYFGFMATYGFGVGMVDAAANMQAVSIQHAYGRVILSSFYAAWSAGAIVGALFVAASAALDLSVSTAQVSAALVVAAGLALCSGHLLPSTEATPSTETESAAFTVPFRALLAVGTAMALFYAIDFSVGNWSALYVKNLLFSDAGTAALALAAYQCAALASRLSGDFWVARYGELAVVRAGSLIGIVGLTVVVLAQSADIAIAGFLVAGLGTSVIAPLCFSTAGRLAPAGQVDGVIAKINLFNYAGTLIGGGIVGGIAAASNLRVGFLVPLLFAAALFLLAPTFVPDEQRIEAGAP